MRRLFLGMIAVLALGAQAESRGESLTVLNPGFESPGGLYARPTDWTADENFRIYVNNLAGQLLAPEGTDVGTYSGFTEGGAASASQVIRNHVIQANATYTLSVLVGGRRDDSGFGFGGSRIELFDADTSAVLAEHTLNRATGPSPLDGIFAPQSISFTTGATGGPIGNRLGIRLTGLGEGPQTWFDNVTLSGPAGGAVIPEPSSVVMLGIGALGVLGYGWRQRRRSDAPADPAANEPRG